jgi:membrane-anchored protein YejM (alkaline phosphatase superfamily)
LLSKVLSLLAVLSSDVPSISGRCLAITVSAVFASSYVPLFVIKLLTSIINQEELTSAQFAVLKIVERSYVINHVANPFIYAFYDSRFRREFKMMFTAAGRPPEMEIVLLQREEHN